ncbi:MAG: 30S ribosomal protein S9 [Actinomycetota bacterium]|nr:30S ribosomal protein S9 [Actinomycetota bacterium]
MTDNLDDQPRNQRGEDSAAGKDQPSEPTQSETPSRGADELSGGEAIEGEVQPAEGVAPEEPGATETPDETQAETPEEPVAAEGPEEPAAAGTPAEATAATPQEPVAAEESPEVELAPRQKPEIPGADLEPDIVPEGEQFLDAEAQAAAEAEAEAAAAREQAEAEEEVQPIADAAIDLAAGARYTATGKRKTAVARVILKPGTGTYAINGRALETAFPRETLQRMIRQPLETVGYDSRMDVVARMHGGGVAAQGGALRHGISRALIVADPNLRGELKRRGFLTRDPRVKERKKAGLKKARKRPQFSKR